MTFFRKIQKYASVLLLFMLLIVMYNNIANQHYHLLPNGQMVVHAHPFSKSESNEPQKQHTHTTSQLFVIAQINNLFTLLLILSFIFWFIQEKLKKKEILLDIELIVSFPKINYRLRAPPSN